jgi:APA family basic amino acid/polyamine antiporter
MALIATVTLVNVRGVRFGGWVMNLLTATKILALLGLIVAAFVSGKGSPANLLPWWPEHWTQETTAAFGLSMIAVLWAFDGWISVTFTAGEMRDPERNIPRALIIGTVGVIALYLGANLAYAWVMPLDVMAGSPRVAADVARLVLGPVGATLVIVGILCSTFGTANGALLAIPRSIYGAAEDGAFPARFARVHPKFHTPAVAIATLGVWGGLLTLSGTYDQITSYVVFGSWFFYALTILSVIVLRRVMPEVPRRYKALGYPWAPLLFAAVAGWFLYNTVVEDPRSAAIGIGLLALGLPFYYRWKPR